MESVDVRAWIAGLALFLVPLSAIAVVCNGSDLCTQQAKCTSSGTNPFTCTISAEASGHVLILYKSSEFFSTPEPITGVVTSNVSWSQIAGPVSRGGTGVDGEIWCGTISGGSSGTSVQITIAAGIGEAYAVVQGLSGATCTVDVTGVPANGSGPTPATGSYTTINNADVVLALSVQQDSLPTSNPGGLWQALTGSASLGSFTMQPNFLIQSTAGSQSASWTIPFGGNNWGTIIVAVKQSGGGGGSTCMATLNLLGVSSCG